MEARLSPDKMPAKYSIDDHTPSNYLDVSRYSIDPKVGYVVPTRQPLIDALVPLPLRKTVQGLLA